MIKGFTYNSETAKNRFMANNRSTMKIYVKELSGNETVVEINENDSILTLGNKIAQAGVDMQNKRILFDAKYILNNQNIKDCGIVNESTLHIFESTRGHNEQISDSWSDYVQMFTNIEWNKSNIPSSYNEAQNKQQYKELIDVIAAETEHTPSIIRSKEDFIRYLKQNEDGYYSDNRKFIETNLGMRAHFTFMIGVLSFVTVAGIIYIYKQHKKNE
eukprot:304287_1